MDDQKLLEAAAKAAGIVVIRSRLHDPLNVDMLVERSVRNPDQLSGAWNPLTDDGDALRLAVKLGIDLEFQMQGEGVEAYENYNRRPHDGEVRFCALERDEDECAATRRAIVRAAAQIGSHE